jgi:hypothetical protein
MSLSLKQTQHISSLAGVLYNFLPANPHPYADQSISFSGCASKVGIGNLYTGGSKTRAITSLLTHTLEFSKGKFCSLIVCIVKTALVYRNSKGSPITQKEMLAINDIVKDIGFKIPELWDKDFLNSLFSEPPAEEVKVVVTTSLSEVLSELKNDFIALTTMEPQPRGYAFQKLLNRLFDLFNLKSRNPFRIVGEEIDGSCEVNGHTYLLEAKYQNKPTPESDLLVFAGKVAGKATWSRGLFISFGGFSKDGLEAFARGKQTNIIGMDAQDLFFILDGKIGLPDALNAKARRAVETNSFFVSVHDLI